MFLNEDKLIIETAALYQIILILLNHLGAC